MTENLHYDFSKCRDLFESAPRNDKEYTEAVKYFHDRCFYTDSGSVYVYKKNKLEYFSKEEFERVQMIGFGPELKKAIAKKIIPYEEVLNAEHFEVDKEGRRVNSLKAMNVTKLRNVEVGEKGLKYVEFFKNYLLDVIANKNVSLCDYILKWLANVIKLKKNKTALIIVSSSEGIGKSSLTKVMEKIVGKDLVTYPSLSSLSKFNFQCYGKLIVCLEETEGLRQNEGALNDNLKNLTANDTFAYEAKGIQPKDLKNVNNVMASSNFSLNVAGRRYINITPSTKWLNRDDLFDQLYDLDDENIKALYDFLLSIDTTGFNEEKEGKKLVMGEGNLKEIERMNNAWKFMKDFYALDKLSEKIKPINLYEKYKQTGIKNIYNKSTFYDKISELNIPKSITNGYEMYKIDGNELYNEFKKRNLIHKEDEGEFEKVFKPEDEKHIDEEKENLKKENNELKKQLAEMQKKIEEMMQKNAPKEEVIIEQKETKKEQTKPTKKIIKVKAYKTI